MYFGLLLMLLFNSTLIQYCKMSNASTITLPITYINTNYIPVGTSVGPRTGNSDYQFHFQITSNSEIKRSGQCSSNGCFIIVIGVK